MLGRSSARGTAALSDPKHTQGFKAWTVSAAQVKSVFAARINKSQEQIPLCSLPASERPLLPAQRDVALRASLCTAPDPLSIYRKSLTERLMVQICLTLSSSPTKSTLPPEAAIRLISLNSHLFSWSKKHPDTTGAPLWVVPYRASVPNSLCEPAPKACGINPAVPRAHRSPNPGGLFRRGDRARPAAPATLTWPCRGAPRTTP